MTFRLELPFADLASRLMREADAKARSLRHAFLGTEHVLLALLDMADKSIAMRVLERLKVNLRTLRRELLKEFTPLGKDTSPKKLSVTPRLQAALRTAECEAKRLGHGSIGTEDILLGLVEQDQGLAGQMLAYVGLNVEEVRYEAAGELREIAEA